MTAPVSCPVCTHREAPWPAGTTFTATGTARLTVTFNHRSRLLHYANVEVDPNEGYRDVCCEHCGAGIKDLDPADFEIATLEPESSTGQPRLRVWTHVNMEVSPIAAGTDAAAHAALVQAA